MYKKIDPYSQVEQIVYADLFAKIFDSNDYVKFNLQELKQVLSSLVIVQLNQNFVREYVEVTDLILFKSSFRDSIGFKSMKAYILQMLDTSNEFIKDILKELSAKEYRVDRIFQNEELKDFCQQNIIETLSFTRTIDFGNFMIEKLSNNSFKSITKEKFDQFFTLNIKARNLSGTLLEVLSRMEISLEEARLAIQVYHSFFNPNYNELRSFQLGQNLIMDNIHYLRCFDQMENIIEKSFDQIIEINRDINLDNGVEW